MRPLELVVNTLVDHAPDDPIEGSERRSLLLEGLALLDDRTRACVVLHLAGEYTFREIGEALGVSAPRCKQSLDKGLARISHHPRETADRVSPVFLLVVRNAG